MKNPPPVITPGFLVDQVCQVASTCRADLILLTSHSYKGLKRLFLGSKAARITRRADRPVLVIPGQTNP